MDGQLRLAQRLHVDRAASISAEVSVPVRGSSRRATPGAGKQEQSTPRHLIGVHSKAG